MEFKKKIEEAEAFLAQLKVQKQEIEEQLTQIKGAELQVLGRITTYKELEQEYNEASSDVDGPVVDATIAE